MNINNNFTPLAWHQGDIELQSNRASCAFGHIVPLIASKDNLLPFQIITRPAAINPITYTICLRDIDGNVVRTLSNVAMKIGVWVFDEYDIVVYRGDGVHLDLPTGQYYLTLESNGAMWYSDVVTIVPDVSKMTRIEWWDEQDLVFRAGRIAYRVGFGIGVKQYKNWMYFLEEIGMPEYTVEEEGDTRDGLFYASKVLSGKKYKMQVAQLTEAMCDALRFVHLADNVTVRDGYGRMYYCDSVLVTPEWQTGAVASASVEITTDTFVKQVGGGYTGDSPVIEGATSIVGQAVIGEDFVVGA